MENWNELQAGREKLPVEAYMIPKREMALIIKLKTKMAESGFVKGYNSS